MREEMKRGKEWCTLLYFSSDPVSHCTLSSIDLTHQNS